MAQFRFSGFEFDPADGSLRSDSPSESRSDRGEPQTLRPQVARLLEEFLAHPGQVLDRERLYRAVWGEDRVVDFEAGLSALVKELRQALRAAGAPDEMLETVPRRGYRFHADVRQVDGDRHAVASDGEVVAVRSGSSRRRLVTGIVVAGLVALLALWYTRSLDEPADADGRPRLAVVPFEMLGSTAASSTNLDLVLADTLLAALWQAELAELVLIGRTSLGAELAGRARAEFVASELGASLVLEGSVIPDRPDDDSEGWRIEARLVRLPRGEVIWASTVTGRPGEPVAVGEVARSLAADLAAHWPAMAIAADSTDDE